MFRRLGLARNNYPDLTFIDRVMHCLFAFTVGLIAGVTAGRTNALVGVVIDIGILRLVIRLLNNRDLSCVAGALLFGNLIGYCYGSQLLPISKLSKPIMKLNNSHE